MTMPSRIFNTDSRAVEAITGIFIAMISAWCWIGHWFGGWMQHLNALAGWEPAFAFVGVLYGIFHFRTAVNSGTSARSVFCIFSAWVFTVLAFLVVGEHGWGPPAGPCFAVAAIVQVWCYLRINWWSNGR